eukprot:GHRR01026437.1.p1 GENE.GHRR01026437.1~~GHRR01026437.1.p1  ORF type:complete len:117 (+),score=45.37 GHRR01026437.1:537-887(+)
MAGPLFLQNIFSYSTSVIAVAFVGHLNDPSLLSSAVLANSLYNVTGYSVISGLSAGMETLCGQASVCSGCGQVEPLSLDKSSSWAAAAACADMAQRVAAALENSSSTLQTSLYAVF